jgi:putative cell wall-binding protein
LIVSSLASASTAPALMRRVLPRLLLAMAVVAVTALAAPSHAAAVGGDTFVALTNEKRASVGVPPVGLSAAVDRISVERAAAMAKSDLFQHDLAYVERRLNELGQCWKSVGEIIAWERGYPSYSYQRTIDAWWASSGHHAIMVGDYNAAGGSWAVSSATGTTYSVMVFVKLCSAPTTSSATAVRVYGADRYSTAAAISAASFAPGVPVAALATGATFPDALAGAPYATHFGGPVLLVRRDDIPDAAAAELARLKPGRIVILGGRGSVSDAVAAAAKGYTSGSVKRIAGDDRYSTAAAISAAAFASGAPVAYVATGETFADAVSGGALAGRRNAPVLLVRSGSIPSPTATELARLKPGRIVILGGPGSVSDAVAAALDRYTSGSVARLWGDDRYSTAVAISAANYASNGPDVVYVSTGRVFTDGLATGPIAGRGSDPVLLVRPDSLPSEVAQELQRLSPSKVIVVGGPGSVSDDVLATIRSVIR